MKVTDLQAYLLSSPLPSPIQVRIAAGQLTVYKQDCLLLRVRTDLGLSGYAAGPASANLAQLINRNLKSAVVNIDPTKVDGLRKKVFQRRPSFPGLVQAFGLIEVALLDVLGKIEGCPVSELLGGRVRQRLPLIAGAGFYLSGEAACEEARAIGEQGFKAYKFRIGLGPDTDAATVRSVRKALPEDRRLVIDAKAWWQMGSSCYPPAAFDPWLGKLANQPESWLAEPFHPDNTAAYHALAKRKLLPVAAGEHAVDPQTWLELAGEGCVDVLQANTVLLGGLNAARGLLTNVADKNCRFILCGATSPLEVLAAAHLASCFATTVCEGIEWPCYSTRERAGKYPFALGDALLKQPVVIENGELIVSTAPGLGAEVNEAVTQRYPWKSGPARVLNQV
jgi:L-alanine-DL-glutamate epimerase-like enolase superfamily enzyme